MKTLIRLLSVVIVLTITTGQLFAQNFGVRAGLNFSHQVWRYGEELLTRDFVYIPGFHIGATAEFPITNMFSFETGLLFITKGASIETSALGATANLRRTLFYLDVPLTGKVSFNLFGVRFYKSLGSYVGIGLSGTDKLEMTIGGQTESETYDIKWGSDPEHDLRRLDFGLKGGYGIQINAIQIGLIYALGLANIATHTDASFKKQNVGWGISVGYTFGGR
jgi:hypothetical protein